MITQDLILMPSNNANSLTTGDDQPIILHPVIAYVGSLKSKNSQRGMMASLQMVTEYYVELNFIRPMQRQDYNRIEAIREAVNVGLLAVQTVKRGARTGQPKLDKQGQPIYIGNPLGLDWSQLNYVTLREIFNAMNEANVAPRTINHAIAAVRGVMREVQSMGLISLEQYVTIEKKIKTVKITTLPKGRDIEPVELTMLATAAKQTTDPNTSTRNLAILAVLRLGLRISEVAGLTRENLSIEGRQLSVMGKGRKERTVPINYDGLRAIQKWLAVRGNQDGPLFLAIHKSGVIQPPKADKNGNLTGMTRQAMTKILQELGTEADIAKFSPHDFRRTLIGDLLDAGVDLPTVSEIVGHSDPATTARYDRRAKKRLFDAMDKLDNPQGGNQ